MRSMRCGNGRCSFRSRVQIIVCLAWDGHSLHRIVIRRDVYFKRMAPVSLWVLLMPNPIKKGGSCLSHTHQHISDDVRVFGRAV